MKCYRKTYDHSPNIVAGGVAGCLFYGPEVIFYGLQFGAAVGMITYFVTLEHTDNKYTSLGALFSTMSIGCSIGAIYAISKGASLGGAELMEIAADEGEGPDSLVAHSARFGNRLGSTRCCRVLTGSLAAISATMSHLFYLCVTRCQSLRREQQNYQALSLIQVENAV